MRYYIIGALLVGFAALGMAGAFEEAARPGSAKAVSDSSANLEEALKKAGVGGKYRMLLRTIKVPEDAKTYQQFKDFGPRDQREYAGHTDLPAGYWVYVAPSWYIWRDHTAVQRPKRSWGPEQ